MVVTKGTRKQGRGVGRMSSRTAAWLAWSLWAVYALLWNFAFPGGEYAAWFSHVVQYPGIILAGVFLTLLFPDGHLLSRRWRIVAWMAVLGAGLTGISDAFNPDGLDTHQYVENPFGVSAAIGGGLTTYELFDILSEVGPALLLDSIRKPPS